MSLALYRKYRPGTFAEVIGQEHVTAPLMQAIRSGRVHHAYLFSGPRGCGKTSSARILARSLNCVQGPTPTPCGECDSCVALAPNGPGSLDVVEIDAASHGGVDDARDLRERAFYAPVSSQFKIYIIDEAHMVTREGFNALLKLVEEPPPHLKFIFATTEPDKVLPTIRSRTHHYPFRLVPPRDLLGLLTRLCVAEGVEVEPTVLPLVVRAGAGSVRDAESVLDQLLAGAGPEGLTYARAIALLGYTDAALLDEVVDAIAAGDGAAVFQAVDRVVGSGHDPRRFTADLLERFRDLLILEAVPDAAEKHLLDAPDDQVGRMQAQAARFGRAQLARAGDILNTGLTEMRGATAPRLLLELICARLLLPGAATDETSVLARLERVERRLEIGGVPASAPVERPTRPTSYAEARPAADTPTAAVEQPPPTPAERPAWPEAAVPASEPQPAVAVTAPVVAPADTPEAAPGALDAAAVRRVWPEVLEAVKLLKRGAHAQLTQYAQVVEVRGRTLVLSFSAEPIRRQFAGTANEDALVTALRDVLGVEWKIESLGPAGGTSGSVAAAAPAPSRVVASAPAPAYDEFAPDDEPADDDEPVGVPDAMALLQEGLGAQVIGELDAG